jgi:hypothetical protein
MWLASCFSEAGRLINQVDFPDMTDIIPEKYATYKFPTRCPQVGRRLVAQEHVSSSKLSGFGQHRINPVLGTRLKSFPSTYLLHSLNLDFDH